MGILVTPAALIRTKKRTGVWKTHYFSKRPPFPTYSRDKMVATQTGVSTKNANCSPLVDRILSALKPLARFPRQIKKRTRTEPARVDPVIPTSINLDLEVGIA